MYYPFVFCYSLIEHAGQRVKGTQKIHWKEDFEARNPVSGDKRQKTTWLQNPLW
jgi:hypothetical protein